MGSHEWNPYLLLGPWLFVGLVLVVVVWRKTITRLQTRLCETHDQLQRQGKPQRTSLPSRQRFESDLSSQLRTCMKSLSKTASNSFSIPATEHLAAEETCAIV